ncbi:MAG: DUF2573 family protein [Bacillus sp. (in: firmicutes)]
MSFKKQDQFQALLDKYTELLVGETNDELREKVCTWALYSHIAKSMPNLANHWNKEFPDAKIELKELMLEIKQLNEQHRQQNQKQ